MDLEAALHDPQSRAQPPAKKNLPTQRARDKGLVVGAPGLEPGYRGLAIRGLSALAYAPTRFPMSNLCSVPPIMLQTMRAPCQLPSLNRARIASSMTYT